MKVQPFDNGIFGATTYLVYDEKLNEAALIDCTCSTDEIQQTIIKNKLNLKYILITHAHFDHVYCLSKMKSMFQNTQILMSKEDLYLLDNIHTQCTMACVEDITVPCTDGFIDENSKNLKIGESEIKIIQTPGHSKGGVCYLIDDNVLFSGDTLFKDSIGRCDLFGGSIEEIGKSIKEKLFKLNDDIIVYPGHGDKTTIGHEKKYNPYFGEVYSR